jgi:hypothetical protein
MSAPLDLRHAAFHSARDIVGLLVQGRERSPQIRRHFEAGSSTCLALSLEDL